MLYLFVLAVFILLLVYISKISALANRLEELARELSAHRGRIQELEGRTSPVSQAAPSSQAPPPVTPPVQLSAPPVSSSSAIASSTQPEPLPTTALPPPKPSRTREEWEALIGGKWLNRIGAVALIIGVGFFLKYAFENNWITEVMRVVIGGVIGFYLLFLAERSKRKGYLIFSQGLVGSGLSVLYLSIYASFNFYALVPQWVAFVLMGAVTVLTFVEAFRNDSLAVAVLGWAGGFLTPFMLSTGTANEIGLFTYIALLDAGILAVVVMRERWVVLHPLTLAATYVVYFLWNVEFYTSDDLLVTVYCLTVFWALFHAVDVLRIFKPVATWLELREALAAANVVFFYPSLYAIVNPEYHETMGIITLALGLVYFLTAQLVRMKGKGEEFGFRRSVFTAFVLLVLATAIQFTGFTTVAWWSVEAAVLVWCGVRWKMRYVWLGASGLFLVAAVKLLFTPEAFGYEPVFDNGVLVNQRALTFLLLGAASWTSAVLLSDGSERIRWISSVVLYYLGCLALFVMMTVETLGYFDVQTMGVLKQVQERLGFLQLMSLAVVWMLLALLLQVAGRWQKILPLIVSSLLVLALSATLSAIRGVAYAPVEEFTLLFNVRTLAVLLVLSGMIATAKLLPGSWEWTEDVAGAVRVGVVLLLLILLTGEARDYFERQIALLAGDESMMERSRLSDLQQLSLSGVWLAYSILLMVAGIWKHSRGLRITAIILFGVTILKIFIYDLSFLDTLYRIFSFIGLGLILLIVSYLYQRYKTIILEPSSATAASRASHGQRGDG